MEALPEAGGPTAGRRRGRARGVEGIVTPKLSRAERMPPTGTECPIRDAVEDVDTSEG